MVPIGGYSPYKDIGELIDPAGADNDKDKWGVVTRLLHLDDVVDGNSLFGLYGKTEVEHFKLRIGEVDLEAEMPVGIGLQYTESEKEKDIESVEELTLIDPMTKEIISRVAELDERGRKKTDRFGNVVYKDNDYWFVLNVKLVLKDVPKGTAGGG